MEEYISFSWSFPRANHFPSWPIPLLHGTEGMSSPLPLSAPSLVLSGTMEKEPDCNKTLTSETCSAAFLKLPSSFSNEVGEQSAFSVPGRILPLADVFLGRVFCWVCIFFFLFKPVADGSPVWFHLAISLLLYCLHGPPHSCSMGQFQSFLVQIVTSIQNYKVRYWQQQVILSFGLISIQGFLLHSIPS